MGEIKSAGSAKQGPSRCGRTIRARSCHEPDSAAVLYDPIVRLSSMRMPAYRKCILAAGRPCSACVGGGGGGERERRENLLTLVAQLGAFVLPRPHLYAALDVSHSGICSHLHDNGRLSGDSAKEVLRHASTVGGFEKAEGREYLRRFGSMRPSTDEPAHPFAVSREPRPWNDVAFSAVFMAVVCIIAAAAVVGGTGPVKAAFEGFEPTAVALLSSPAALGAVVVFGPCAAVCLIVAWLMVLKRHARVVLTATLLFAVAFNAAVGLVLLLALGSFSGLGLLMAAVMTYWYYSYVKSRIPFASECLRVACDALEFGSWLVPFGCTMAAVQLVWVLLWTVGSATISQWLIGSSDALSISQQGFREVRVRVRVRRRL